MRRGPLLLVRVTWCRRRLFTRLSVLVTRRRDKVQRSRSIRRGSLGKTKVLTVRPMVPSDFGREKIRAERQTLVMVWEVTV